MTHTVLSQAALDQLFFDARSYNGWLNTPVSTNQIRQIHDLVKMAPTSANMQPARFVWCTSSDAKARLAACALESNKIKITSAPVCVIIGMDNEYHEHLPWLFPHTDARSWFADDRKLREDSAFRNSSLQGAYLMLAARAIGLDVGPMSGIDLDAVNRTFFADQPDVVTNFICSIGHGDPASIFDRNPRPDFERFNTIL